MTTIQPSSVGDTISLNNLSNVSISGFTILANAGCTGPACDHAIRNIGSSPYISANTFLVSANGVSNESSSSSTIENNKFIGLSGGSACEVGIDNYSSSTVIERNSFKGFGCVGIDNSSSSAIISNNTITDNGGYGIRTEGSSSVTISGNTILALPTSRYTGIFGTGSSSLITNNRITGHTTDIRVMGNSAPNISFNIYDTVDGSGAVGKYNVTSAGMDAPLQ